MILTMALVLLSFVVSFYLVWRLMKRQLKYLQHVKRENITPDEWYGIYHWLGGLAVIAVITLSSSLVIASTLEAGGFVLSAMATILGIFTGGLRASVSR